MKHSFSYFIIISIFVSIHSPAFAADPFENYNAFTPAGRENPELEQSCRQELGLTQDTIPAATFLFKLRRCISLKKAKASEQESAKNLQRRRQRLIAKTIQNAPKIQRLLERRARAAVARERKKSITRLSARPDRTITQEILNIRTQARIKRLKKETERSELIDFTRNFNYRTACAGLKRDERIQCIRKQISNLNIGGAELK